LKTVQREPAGAFCPERQETTPVTHTPSRELSTITPKPPT
jgi:hypothetical protein